MTAQTSSQEPAGQRRGIFTPELLDRCISCGFCLPACPTYSLTREETSSPRGRINLMRAIEMGGTITGEHGVGMVKLKYMESQHGPEYMALLRRIKAAFDPNNILNPGKLGS